MSEFIIRKPHIVVDIEVNPNVFHVGFKSIEKGKVIQIETKLGVNEKLSFDDIMKLKKILQSYTTIGFNSLNYDIPMLKGVIKGMTNIQLFNMSKAIIEKRLQPWQTEKEFELPRLTITHIDLQEPSPGVMVSLKKYGARMHSKKLQDLPYEYDKHLTQEEHELNKLYNINDLDTTIDLYHAVKGEIDLRYVMSDKYKIDLMSKGGAQIAETVIVAELAKKGVEIQKFKPPKNYIMKYTPPSCLSFKDERLTDILNKIVAEDFKLSKGKVVLPEWLQKPVLICDTFLVQMGIGGLHSKEKSKIFLSDDEYILKNCDIASYYPSMILEYGYYPKNIGKVFLTIYGEIKAKRLEHKKAGNKLESDSLKLTINGSFGKFGSNYSKLFAPELLIHVTLTGQLLLIMLIEELINNDVEILSTNTDGIEYKVHKSKEKEIETIINNWSKLTGMEMEHGTYKALYSRDVNNYVAVYDKEPKAKGAYAPTTISKDAEFSIVYKAIREYLHKGTYLEDTINKCDDVREFIACKSATGGAEWINPLTNEKIFIGKVARWVYSRKNGNAIYKIKASKTGSFTKVPTTDYAVPIMELPYNNEIPDYLDKEYYILLAIERLERLGVDYLEKHPMGF